ncbi:hypothetical protein [Paraburkholderia azotifigens]|uniref:hypothetical protein n=1 Tax=Paraburkholderia azotifigens TaxID=2057004 RepID=UPI00319DCED1
MSDFVLAPGNHDITPAIRTQPTQQIDIAMIGQITGGKLALKLYKKYLSENWSEVNLFNADTFNLLIGENGSGKTSILRKIAWS